MLRIDRAAIPAPTCLVPQPAATHYDRLTAQERQEIRAALLTLQRNRCAYCERRTGDDRGDGHIEHFRKQANQPALSLTWTNMFWSCNDENTCGKHKDKCDRVAASGRLAKFNPDDIVDPGNDNPRQFFLFTTNGDITVNPTVDVAGMRRATETLRVFQLQESALLRRSREDAVKPYLRIIDLMIVRSPEMIMQYAQAELAAIQGAPFATPIQQYLEGFLQ